MSTPRLWDSALRVALVYLVVGGAWILGSDQLVNALAANPDQILYWQTYKGGVFVILSAGLIYVLVRREIRRRTRVERLFGEIVEIAPDPLVVRRREDDVIVTANQRFAEEVGRPLGELVGQPVSETGVQLEEDARARFRERLAREGEIRNYLQEFTTAGGDARTALVSSKVVAIDERPHVVTIAKDITELQRARREVQRHVERLQALREIDQAITGSVELELTLNVVLDQVRELLGVDAADILILHPHTEMLEFAVGRGFHTDALAHTELGLGEGYAGQVARDRTRVRLGDIWEDPDGFLRSPALEGEDFVAYVGQPIVSKGEVRGVLELFHRERLDPDPDWYDFLEALAEQTAIAVDNGRLLASLESANRDLRRAYDDTIKGWARALDMRDRETHSHTERVTELTVRLGRTFGIPDEELVHVRRGALLHDIGKMGVPDEILQKPGPLDEDEWEIMRRHPEFAHRLLAPIEYLRPALDIPYCHHEKWDGSGYPRGLEGEQIPLAARIFAVVDVWDALRSDRPYRDAWPRDRVRDHLEQEKGSHFQPEIVDAFLRLEAEMDQLPPLDEV